MHNPNMQEWRILLVDDDEDDSRLTQSMLFEAQGHKVTYVWASTYLEGKDLLHQNHFDAVLVDYDLGLRTGIEFIQEAASTGYTAPLILFTGRGSFETDVEAMQAGATLYLTKNETSPLILERSIRYAIERKQIEEELRSSRDEFKLANERLKEELAKRQRMEADLRYSEERFNKAFKVSPNAQVLSRQVDGTILEINDSFEKLFGYSREEVIGKSSLELNMFAHPDDRRKIVERLQGEKSIRNVEVEVRTKTGELRIVSLGVEILTVVNDIFMLTNVEDITERKQVEAEREQLLSENRRQREFLEKLIQEAPVAIAVLQGPEHRYIMANPMQMHLTRGKGEIVGRTVEQVWPESADKVIPILDQVYISGEPFQAWSIPFHMVRDKGPEQAFFNVSYSPIVDEQGQVEGTLALAVETTTEVLARRQVENERARLEAVLQSLPVGVWIVDKNGQIVGKNDQADRIWAGDAPLLESIEQYPQYQAWYPESGKVLLPEEYSVAKVLRTGQPVEPVELNIRRFDGIVGTILASAAPIKDKEGQLQGVVGIGLDITRQKQAEHALLESEMRYQTLFESIDEGFCIIEVLFNDAGDPIDYRFLETNPAFVNQTGLHDAVGKRMRDLAPQHEQHWFDIYGRIALTGEAERFTNEARQLDDRWYDVYAFRFGRPEERKVAILFHDITRRRRMEEELRASEARFRLMGETLPYGVWMCDKDGRALYTSQSFLDLLEMTMEESAGFGWTHRLPPDEVEPMMQRWMHCVRTGEDWDDEHHILGPDGKYHTVLTRGKPVRDEQGNILSWVGINLDIDERKDVEKTIREYARKLEQSNQELENFAYMASHDMQEPLRKISAFGKRAVERMKADVDDEDKEFLKRMLDASRRMQDMIDALLELSRINSHGRPFVSVDLNEAAMTVVSDLENRIELVGGKVVVDKLPTIKADPVQMHQLLQNLIGNALKYHQPDAAPRVHITAETFRNMGSGRPEMVVITVRDNGIGFDEKHHDRIFQPFQRLVGHSQFEGSGIGLAICRKIVERHGGTITARSKPGEGSTFIVTLPYGT